MKKNKLTVYLSYSLAGNQHQKDVLKSALEANGFEVTHYINGESYNPHKLHNADFVIFLPNSLYTDKQKINNINHYEFFASRGQYDEACYCTKSNKPSFIFHYNINNEIFVSKLTDENRGYNHSVYDSKDWKKNYGVINSHCLGSETLLLLPFIEGHFKLLNYPLTPEECYITNRHILLL